MEDDELAEVQRELEALVQRRWLGGLSPAEEAYYQALTARELVLLGRAPDRNARLHPRRAS